MKIAVLVKEVPDLEAHVEIAAGGTALNMEKKRVLNYFDEIAVEAALQVKQSIGSVEIYAVTAGNGTGIEALRRALAMGVDRIIHINDPALEGAGPLVVSQALAGLIKREGFDLVFAGKKSTDDEAGMVGPMVAALLGIACVQGVTALEIGGTAVTAKRETERGTETVKVSMPVALTAEKGFYTPRVPQVMGIMKAMRAEVPKVSLAEVGVEVAASPQVRSYSRPKVRLPVKMIEGAALQAASELVRLLRDEVKVI
jgi:electron transfer flavoprotein beta subunit